LVEGVNVSLEGGNPAMRTGEIDSSARDDDFSALSSFAWGGAGRGEVGGGRREEGRGNDRVG
jgi:hypothetical protein